MIEIFMLFSKKIAEDLELLYSFFYYIPIPLEDAGFSENLKA
jgi:hypothetical protein